jgi:hypothetical protein
MGKIKCSCNVSGACCTNPTPLNRDSSEGQWWWCDEGDCSHPAMLNATRATELNTHKTKEALYTHNGSSIIDLLYVIKRNLGGSPEKDIAKMINLLKESIIDIKNNLGATSKDGDETIGDKLDILIDNLGSTSDDDDSLGRILSNIRANIGANGDDGGTIAGRLDNMKKYLKDELGGIAYSVGSIDTNTYR